MQTKKLPEWLSQIEHSHSKKIDLELERITAVAGRLELLEPEAFVITVAGTNGKGSTVALLENILKQHGYHVGSYTSPHLFAYNERIKLNAEPASEDLICQAFSIIEAARGSISLSYFEYSTLAALVIFKQQNVDFIVLEVGLGGRLDAVNIINPDLVLLTNISLDHCDWLGDTRELIGAEKAGVFREGISVVYGEANVPKSIINLAKEKQCQLFVLDQDYQYECQNGKIIWNNGIASATVELASYNSHPNNIALVLKAVTLLQQEFDFNIDMVAKVCETIQAPGRCQIINMRPLHIIDVAHNPASAQYLANFLQQKFSNKKIKAIFSMLKDKDIKGTLEPLKKVVSHWYIAELTEARAASLEQLELAFMAAELTNYKTYSQVLEAYNTALKDANSDDILLIFGSFHTVSNEINISVTRACEVTEITLPSL